MGITHETITHRCPFCGKELETHYTYDDGVDWMGHGRGQQTSKEQRERCTCKWGRLENKMPQIKPMCLNCYYYSQIGGVCENKEERKTVEELNNFELRILNMKVKDPTQSCRHYELNYGIFDSLIEGKEIKNPYE